MSYSYSLAFYLPKLWAHVHTMDIFKNPEGIAYMLKANS